MDSDPVLSGLNAYGLKAQGRGEYRCKSPFRNDSDSDSFTYNTDKGIGHDMVSDQGYNRQQIAAQLGITLAPEGERIQVNETRRKYRDLKDYALEQGVPVEVFERAGWKLATVDFRPCFSFPTATGLRFRFMDGNKPKYKSEVGYRTCWYGLDKAIAMQQSMLVLCNGEASTIVAQYYGIPAFCKTAGELRIPEPLQDEFALKGFDGSIWIALDCDTTGRERASQIQQQFKQATVLDLGLTDKGDLANFCKLYTSDSLQALRRLVPTPRPEKPDLVYAHTVAVDAIQSIEEPDTGIALVTPFTCLHRLGGYAHILEAGKLALICAPTGSGKTSWLESWADHWLQMGIGGVWRGDEFSPQEYHNRRIQRYSTLTMTDIRLHRQALREAAEATPAGRRIGVLLPRETVRYYQEMSYAISEWAAKLAYFEGRRENKYLEPMLDILTNEVNLRRGNGESVGFAVFDYLQLLRSQGKALDDNAHEYNLGLIKEWTIDMQIVSLVGSQMTKAASENNKRGGDTDAYGAQWVRTDKANLVIFPRLVYEDGKPTGEGFAAVVKNSNGDTDERVAVKPDFRHLCWRDMGVRDLGKDA